MKKAILSLVVGGFVAFGGVGFGLTSLQTTVAAYPFRFCTSSGGVDGYVKKSLTDIGVPLSNLGVLIDSSTSPLTYKCITIDRTLVNVDSDDIDDRGLIDSGESNCIDCMSEWE